MGHGTGLDMEGSLDIQPDLIWIPVCQEPPKLFKN